MRVIAIVICLVSLYVLLAPVFPDVSYQLEKNLQLELLKPSEQALTEFDQANRIEIPAILVNIKLVPSYTEDALSLGAWLLSNSALPGQKGNVVISAHRFQYLLPVGKTFYHLDKVQKEDKIRVFWEGEMFEYSVSEKFEVAPDDLTVLNDFGDSRLTLYTCTPVWNPERRLVVVAFLVDAL